jgi:hypothetical protein
VVIHGMRAVIVQLDSNGSRVIKITLTLFTTPGLLRCFTQPGKGCGGCESSDHDVTCGLFVKHTLHVHAVQCKLDRAVHDHAEHYWRERKGFSFIFT